MKDFKPIIETPRVMMPVSKTNTRPLTSDSSISVSVDSQIPIKLEREPVVIQPVMQAQPKEQKPEQPRKRNFFKEQGKFDYLY